MVLMSPTAYVPGPGGQAGLPGWSSESEFHLLGAFKLTAKPPRREDKALGRKDTTRFSPLLSGLLRGKTFLRTGGQRQKPSE